MPDLISLDRKEFEAFLTDYQAFVERSQKILDKIDRLQKANKDLQDELLSTRNRLQSFQEDLDMDVRQTDDTLRKARETIAQLIKETESRNLE
jgi:predicted  nucleic acid-binding Zn-ribbon protein